MPKPSQLLDQSFKDVDDVQKKKLKELGRIIDSIWAQGGLTESVYSPGGGGGGGANPADLYSKPFVTVALDGELTSERVLTAGVGIGLADTGANGTITVSNTLISKPYVTVALDGELTAERVLTAGGGINIVDGGVNGPITVSVVYADPTGLIGMTAVNGVLATALRSDSRHAIDPAITPTWTGKHRWNVGSAPAIRIGSDVVPSVGIDSLLQIIDESGASDIGLAIELNSADGGLWLAVHGTGDGPAIYGRSSQGTRASPTAVLANDYLLNLVGGGWYGTTGADIDPYSATIQLRASENWSSTAQGSHIDFRTTPIGSALLTLSAKLTGAGQWQLPVTGSAAGILIGGDFQIYRSAADMGRTPDGLTVDLGLNIGSASSAATGEARASVGFAARTDGSGAGFWAGAASDVQLYRSAADVWYTPDSLQVNSYLGVGTAPDAAVGALVEHASIAVVGRVVDAGTTNTPNGVIFRHQTSGTPAAGFGFTDFTQLDSDGAEIRSAAAVTTTWVVATDASRTARTTYSVYDSGGAREYMRGQASGTAAMIGFLGAAAVVRQTLGNAATDPATTQTLANNLRTALINLGLGQT